MARILLITPAGQSSLQGNQITADRWAGILRSLRHDVELRSTLEDGRYDVLVALHARKSAAALNQAARRFPHRPRIVALTGTDLYRDLSTSRAAQRSLDLATRIVLLQPHGRSELPPVLHDRVRVIYQSAAPYRGTVEPLKNAWEVCVSGHLRTVKDPFRAARAARRLPPHSRIRITHLGAAMTAAMERRARAEMDTNPRYRWLGAVPRWQARRLLARSRLLVLSSRMEGGANVVAEALVSGVPVLSSKISGSLGMLGTDYPGYFEVGATQQLADLLQRCEEDSSFLRSLRRYCRVRSKLFRPGAERSAWQALLAELKNSRPK